MFDGNGYITNVYIYMFNMGIFLTISSIQKVSKTMQSIIVFKILVSQWEYPENYTTTYHMPGIRVENVKRCRYPQHNNINIYIYI